MDPFLIPRYFALVFGFWIRLLGRKRFWTLFAISTLVVVVLIIFKV